MSASQSEFFPGADLAQADRKLCVTFAGIRFEIADPPPSWRAPLKNCLICLDCDDYLAVFPPCCIHRLPLATYGCSSRFLEPASPEDCGLLELKYPLSDADSSLGERFRSHLSRLTKEGSNGRTS